jgi:hypothetical protein
MKTRVAARHAVLLTLAVSIAACRTAPINQPEIHLTTLAAASKLTEGQIADAIQRGGKARGWEMAAAGPGHITGTLRVRDKHLAVTDISYSKTQIRIAYKSSEGLSYGDGKIHRNYNKWVEQLADSIRKQIGSAS